MLQETTFFIPPTRIYDMIALISLRHGFYSLIKTMGRTCLECGRRIYIYIVVSVNPFVQKINCIKRMIQPDNEFFLIGCKRNIAVFIHLIFPPSTGRKL